MVIVKLLGSVLAFATALAAYLLDHRWRDRRTSVHKSARRTFVVVMAVAAVHGATVLIMEQRQEEQRHRDTLRAEANARDERERLSSQIDDLNELLGPLASVAERAFPELQPDQALAKLPDRFDELERFVRDTVGTISAFEVEVTTTLSGPWTDGSPPSISALLRMGGTGPDNSITFATPDGEAKTLELYAETLSNRKEGDHLILTQRGAVQPGAWVFGESIPGSFLLQEMQYHLYGLSPTHVPDGFVTIDAIKIKFFINGQLRVDTETAIKRRIEVIERPVVTWRRNKKPLELLVASLEIP